MKRCCCSCGAAVGKRHGIPSDEWPEFDCVDCPTHGCESVQPYRCKRHTKALKDVQTAADVIQ